MAGRSSYAPTTIFWEVSPVCAGPHHGQLGGHICKAVILDKESAIIRLRAVDSEDGSWLSRRKSRNYNSLALACPEQRTDLHRS